MVGAHLPPLVVEAKPLGFVYNLVLICLGLGTCMVFASVPLLIFWFKPEIKDYYGASAAVPVSPSD